MTSSTEVPAAVGPVWTAAAVARRLGVAPGTLRSWSQRYGIGPEAHLPGRHRRYTATDLAELEAVHDLVARGMTLHSAAAVVRGQRHAGAEQPSARSPRERRPVPSPTPAPTSLAAAGTPAASVPDLVAAAARLDSAAATGIVTAGLAQLGALAAWEQLCRPALDGLDPAVADDRGCVDSQLLLSRVLTTCLHSDSAAPGDRPVLLACTAREQHTLALDVLHAALAERGVPTRVLGAAVPAPALRHAAGLLHPRAVVMWAQRAATATPDVAARLSAHTDTVLAAGPGWGHGELPAGVTRTDNLPAALALIRNAITPP